LRIGKGVAEHRAEIDLPKRIEVEVGCLGRVGTHRFRLRQVDLDGSSAIYGPVDTRIRIEEPVKLTAPAPSPASESATTFFAVKEKARVRIRLYNALG